MTGLIVSSPVTKWKAELMGHALRALLAKGATVFSNETQGQPVRASL